MYYIDFMNLIDLYNNIINSVFKAVK